MFKNYFKGIEGIANYPMVSLLVFFIFFIAITAWWIRADKKQLKELSEIPLNKSEQDSETMNS